MTFENGDRIKVITDRWDTQSFIQQGQTGIIQSINSHSHLWFKVYLDSRPGVGYSYQADDIEHYGDKFAMPEPEMGLDEIHAAQELMK